MFSGMMLAVGLFWNPGTAHTPDNSFLQVKCDVFHRCGWHRVDKITHPIGAGVTHIVNETGHLINRADKGVNNWWERVKHDWGPSINRGAIHFVTTVGTSFNNFLTHPCPSGTDTTFTDRNGNTIHKCQIPTNGQLPPPGPGNQGFAGEKDEVAVQVQAISGPKIFVKYCPKVPFQMTVEVFDHNVNAWIARFIIAPDGCTDSIAITPDDTGHGSVGLRFYYHNNQEVTEQYLNDGDVFTL